MPEINSRVVRVRRRLDVIGASVGLAGFGLTALLARNGLAPGEEAVFVAVNSLPDWVYNILWPFMQYGMFFTIPVLSVIALGFKRFHLAGAMAASGLTVYVLAKVVKEFVQRGRPGTMLAHVIEREPFTGLGYPSGHTAVAGAMTIVVTPYLRGRWKIVPTALLIVVFIGRMYVSAHVPLDLLGGAAMGIAAGCLVNLVLGVPSSRSTERETASPLVEEPEPASTSSRSAPVGLATGEHRVGD